MTIQVNKNTKAYFEEIGITEEELKVYLALIELREATVAQITKKVRIPRTSVVRYVEKLMRKALVSSISKNSVKLYIAENPKKIEKLVKEKEIDAELQTQKAEELKKKFPDVLSYMNLNSFDSDSENNVVSVNYYQGLKGFKEVHDRSLDYADGEIMFISNHSFWREAYTEKYDKEIFVPKRIRMGIKNRSLVMKNEQGIKLAKNSKKVLREVRYLPDSYQFANTIILYKDNVSIMVSSSPYIAINIKSESVYKTFKNIYENIWLGAEVA